MITLLIQFFKLKTTLRFSLIKMFNKVYSNEQLFTDFFLCSIFSISSIYGLIRFNKRDAKAIVMKVALPAESKKETIAKKRLEINLNKKVLGKDAGSGNIKNTENKKPPLIRDAKTSPWKNERLEKQYTRIS